MEVSPADSLGGEQDVTLVLQNVGGAPLDIAEVKPSCACTVMQALETMHLEKGASVAIKLRVSPPVYGTSDVTVVAHALAPNVPPAVLSLHLHGSVEVPVLFTATNSVDLAGANANEELVGVVDLLTDESAVATAWVTALESSSPEVTTELIERKADVKISEEVIRCSYAFAVRGATPERGSTVSFLTPRTSTPPSGKNKLLPTIQVTRHYSPVVRALPGELLVRRRGNNSRVQCRLAIVADDQQPFKVNRDGEADWFTVSADVKSSGSSEHRHVLLVEIDTDKYRELAAGAIPALLLSTTHPKCKRLSVPVRVLVD